MRPQRDPVTKQIVVSFYRVYNQLGLGFLESVYRRALRVALAQAGLHVAEEIPVEVIFDGVCVGLFRTDLLVDGRIAVEIKAAKAIEDAHIAQVINFLRASRLELGMLMNFGPAPGFKRLISSNSCGNLRPPA